jgi:O-antigen ligase
MKSKTSAQTTAGSTGAFEIALLALPFLALTPNFFAIPDLSYQGLATQELVFAIVAVLFTGMGLMRIVRSKNDPLPIDRELLLIFAALLIFILWQAVSLAWAPTLYEGVRVAGIWLGFGVFFIAGALGLRKTSAERLHYVMTVIAVILAVSLLYERMKFGDKMYGIFFSHGISSELLATLLPLQVLNYLRNEKRWVAAVSLAASGLSLVALLVGLRRGAIIAATVSLTAIGLALAFKQIRVQNKQRLVILLALILVASAAVGVRFRDEIALRIQGATRLDSAEAGLSTRLRGWITAWEMGKRHPLLGVGNAGYPNLFGEYRKHFASNPRYAGIPAEDNGEYFNEIRSPLVHNEYLQIFVELGVIGLLLFAAFWFLLLRRLWQKRGDPWVFGAMLGLIAFGISSFSSAFSFRFTPGAFIIACLLGIGFAFAREESGEGREQSPLSIPLPKAATIACAAIALLSCLLLSARNYDVYASQQLQGRANLSVPPLDFNFFPNNPAGNEALARRYERVLELDSENAGAHLGYGLLLFQMKQLEKAIPHIEFARRNGYGRPFASVLLAFAHEQKGDASPAMAILRDCIASFPQTIYARAAYAELLRKSGLTAELRQEQEAMYRLNAVEAQSWELALKMKVEEAMEEAKRRNLITPDRLRPQLASALVGGRAFHYLK